MLAPPTRFNAINSRWTDEREERLTALWAEGLTCSQIAHELGNGHTRNSIVGKAHRLGLNGRKAGVLTPEQRAANRLASDKKYHGRLRASRPPKTFTPKSRVTFTAPPAPIADQDIPPEQRKTLSELTEHTCKWPVGEGKKMFFCGAAPTVGSVYCGLHFWRSTKASEAA